MSTFDDLSTTYIRVPFEVRAVEITENNIAELAPLVGELKTTDDGASYIQASRRLVGNEYKIWPGFFITRVNDRYRCYSRRVFDFQFEKREDEALDVCEHGAKANMCVHDFCFFYFGVVSP